MANRLDFYFKQKVTEAELDEAFDHLEQAIFNLAVLSAHGDHLPQDLAQAVAGYRRSAALGLAQAHFVLGCLAQSGDAGAVDLTAARQHYQAAADLGHAGAQCNLGAVYAMGAGVSADPVLAAQWYHRSADQGDALARCNWGLLLLQSPDAPQRYAQAFDLLRQSADAGNAEALYTVGVMYAQGWGVPADAAQAALCFEPAALKNHADAWFNLGVIYASASDGAADAVPGGSREDGHAFARDIPRAVSSLRAAAELGCAQAHHNLGVLYALGQGTPVDVWEAATHYQAAAEAGDPSAQYALGMLLAQENPAVRDGAASKQASFALLEASALLRAAADQGHPGALQQYTLMHADSRDFQPDFRRILDNYRSLADSGDAAAQFNLALMYDLGQGTPGDQALAAHWYAKAAAQNQLAAQYNLGVMGWRSRDQDASALDKARAQWEAAAAAGLAEAQFALGVLAALGSGDGSALAVGYFEQAAEQGHVQAMVNLANGLRLAAPAADAADPAALSRAAQTYERAALQGDPLAMYMLARAHWHAEGLPHDPVLTVDWYTRAADAGDAGAQFCLGHMYANGEGVAQDYALAARWYLAAAGLPPNPPRPLAQAQEVGLSADIQG